MDVVIAGGHGQIALRLARLLSARGERVRSLIRNPDHASDVEAAGAEAVVADLEELDDLAPFVEGADAVVFAAGAGPGSGPERKRTVDYGAAVKLVDAARAAGVRRYVMVSSIGADDPSAGSEAMRPYLEAKADADAAVASSGLDFTIVRPGRLTNDPGTARIAVGERLERADITRDDVAAVLVAVLDERHTVGRTFVVVQGDAPIVDALRQL
ncbi:MAG TPA: SDR family oxidoreductase [Solirubrobacteraceae bacterium]|nr:SDR family oxidoreductase [Solirubrobacteraceae bacterium]